MIDFFLYLFDSNDFGSHGAGWTTVLLIFYLIPNLIITFSFFYISYEMFRLYSQRKKEIPKSEMFRLLMFCSLFIGLSRLGLVFIFFFPIIRFYLLLNWISAILIFIVVMNLRPTVTYLLFIPSVEVSKEANRLLSRENEIRRINEQRLELLNKNLMVVIQRLEGMLRNEVWLHDRREALKELTEMIGILKSTRTD